MSEKGVKGGFVPEGFTADEIKRYEELSRKLNCYITVEKGKVKIEFWGPYYNYADWTKRKEGESR